MAGRPIRAGALAALGVGLLSLEAAAVIGLAPRVGAWLESERGSDLARAPTLTARTVAAVTSREAAEVTGGLVAGAVRHAVQAYAMMLSVTPSASAQGGKAIECGAVPCSMAPGSCPAPCGAPSVEAPAQAPEAPIERGAS